MATFTSDENGMIDECYQFMENLVQKAGELVKEGYAKNIADVEVADKVANWDMVTEYDRKVEAFLINEIKNNYPEHRYVQIDINKCFILY